MEALDLHTSRLDAAVVSLERAETRLEAFRASVLKAAVEGRLVPTEAELARSERRPYEPADVLLARILKERRRRWEEAELVKMKAAGKTPKDDSWKKKYEEPEAPKTSTLPGLPQGWCWATLDQLLGEPLANGKSVRDGSGFPVLRLTSIKQGGVDLDECKRGDWADIDPHNYTIKPDDFLIVRGNGSIHLVGRGGRVTEGVREVAYPDTMIRARVVPQALIPALLPHWWDGPTVRTHIERRARTTAGIHKVNQTDLAQTPLPLPPLSEQTRILEEIDRVVSVSSASGEQVKRASLRAARLRQSLLKWAFEGKLVVQNPADESADVLLARIRSERSATAAVTKTRVRRFKAAS
jgi:type I restriction enzyme S subunit